MRGTKRTFISLEGTLSSTLPGPMEAGDQISQLVSNHVHRTVLELF